MNLDLGYDYIISRLLCKKWKFLGKIWQEHRCAKTQSRECGTSSEKARVLGFHESLSAYLYIISKAIMMAQCSGNWAASLRKAVMSPQGPFLIRDCSCPFLSSTYVQGSAFLEKDRKTDPPCPSTGHSVREWNKSENIHYRIWIPAVCSQLCLLLASHSVPLHLYFLVCSDMTWS